MPLCSPSQHSFTNLHTVTVRLIGMPIIFFRLHNFHRRVLEKSHKPTYKLLLITRAHGTSPQNYRAQPPPCIQRRLFGRRHHRRNGTSFQSSGNPVFYVGKIFARTSAVRLKCLYYYLVKDAHQPPSPLRIPDNFSTVRGLIT